MRGDQAGVTAKAQGKIMNDPRVGTTLPYATYFICLTMVLFPDSPAPGTEGTDGQEQAQLVPQSDK